MSFVHRSVDVTVHIGHKKPFKTNSRGCAEHSGCQVFKKPAAFMNASKSRAVLLSVGVLDRYDGPLELVHAPQSTATVSRGIHL